MLNSIPHLCSLCYLLHPKCRHLHRFNSQTQEPKQNEQWGSVYTSPNNQQNNNLKPLKIRISQVFSELTLTKSILYWRHTKWITVHLFTSSWTKGERMRKSTMPHLIYETSHHFNQYPFPNPIKVKEMNITSSNLRTLITQTNGNYCVYISS